MTLPVEIEQPLPNSARFPTNEMPIYLYHITHLNNLVSIIESRGLQAKAMLDTQGLSYEDIAHERLQDRRATTTVPCGSGGNLHDYVPFYFGPRPPMLYSIHQGFVEGYQQGQSLVVHLLTTAEAVQNAGIPFTFTDGHAVMAYTNFFTDLERLPQVVDLPLMRERLWFDSAEEPNRKWRRQAEFLVYRQLPWELILGIAVIDSAIEQQVQQLISGASYQPRVAVRAHWYY